MRNLNLQNCESYSTSLCESAQVFLDTSKETLIFYYTTKNALYVFNTESGSIKKLFEIPSIIVNAELLALDNQICLASEEGEVIVIDTETNETKEGTYCDVGIESMCWSPDQEVVVFVTKNQHVVLMNCAFDIISEHSLAEDIENQFVSLGWGKKETQFHGSKGKSKAVQQASNEATEHINELPTTTHITWRGDAAYFAVSYLDSQQGRVFKIFDKEGQFCFKSEALKYLSPVFAWRPSGNWIAMPQCLPNKSIIVLFEKNGLKHREITLPFNLKEEQVEKISWSNDSNVLSLQTSRKESDEQRLYLYTIGNYHWYLKQVLIFNALDDCLVTHTWDNRCDQAKTLHVLLKSGKHLIYSWRMLVNKTNQSLVGVIDGKKLLLTDFAQNIVPPPMCQKELILETDSFINAFDFNENKIFLYDAHMHLHIYNIDDKDPTGMSHKVTLQPAENILALMPLSHIRWLTEQTIIAINIKGELSFINVDEKNTCYDFKTYSLGSKVLRISNILNGFYANLADGSVYFFKLNADKNIDFNAKKSSYSLHEEAEDIVLSPANELIIWLSNQSLNIDGQHIASGVTSFCVFEDFLIYTQLSTLCFVHMQERNLTSRRKIEGGAKLVTTVQKHGRIVMQMPRGNLEVITPRILVLQYIGKLLNAQQYNEAFVLSRKHRINLNILCDHNICDFIQNLPIFLNEITNTQWLNLFLSDLQNEDFTTTMYGENYKQGERIYPADFKISEKVNYLCRNLCTRMIELNEAHFKFSLLTAYVKMGEVEKALTMIWQQKQLEEQATKLDCNTFEAEKALRYLFYLVDVNDLYNVALGTYDFRLVLYVAQHSQKDPREFLLTLNELNSLDNDYRCFCIDKHLKRHELALKHIIRCGESHFSEALAFIKEHELFRLALQNYAELNDSEHYQEVALAYADFLRANGKFHNASLMYERGGNLKQAQLCARHILDWERVLYLAKKLQQDVSSVALSLVCGLQEKGEYEVCYHLTINYSSNVADALKFLLTGKLYLKAILSARLLDENKFIEVLTSDLLSYISILNTNLKADKDLYLSHKARLLLLRVEQKNKKSFLEQDDHANQIDESDLLSDTTSLRSSKYTNSLNSSSKYSRSSKNRRKHERKLLSLKPGNPYEEIALIDALHDLVLKITSTKQQQHIRDICKALLELQLDNDAAGLQLCYKSILRLVQDSLSEIWIPEVTNVTQAKSFETDVNYSQLQNEQRYSMLDPIKRLRPILQFIDWEQSIIN